MTQVHHIFLSYSRKDTEIMQRIRDDLRAAGLTVWTDEHIEAGTQSWKRAIEDAIRKAKCLVCLLSPEAAASEWVREELDFAGAQKKQCYLILARGDQSNAIPFGFSTHQWVDIRQDYNRIHNKLIPTILSYVGMLRTPEAEVSPITRTVVETLPVEAAVIETLPDNISPSLPVLTKQVEVQKTISSPQPSPTAWARGRLIAVGVFIAVVFLGAAGLIINNTQTQTNLTQTQTAQVAQTQAAPPIQTRTAQAFLARLARTDHRIAFVSDRDGNAEIYVMNADGSNPLQLTDSVLDNDKPTWSPNGTRIAFQSERDMNWEIYVMHADGTNQINLTNNEDSDFSPAWSPDGTQIAFVSNRDGNPAIYVMNADGSNLLQLTNQYEFVDSPAWSPNGTQIAFVSNRDGNPAIYVMNADGSNLVRISNGRSNNPAWSPDGTQIVFDTTCIDFCPAEIYVMNADGSNQVHINIAGANSDAAWSPDGTYIVFTSSTQGNREIYVMNADGSDPINITNNSAYDSNPSVRP